MSKVNKEGPDFEKAQDENQIKQVTSIPPKQTMPAKAKESKE